MGLLLVGLIVQVDLVIYQIIVVCKGMLLLVLVIESFDCIVVFELIIVDVVLVLFQEYFVCGCEIGSINIFVYNECGNFVQLVDVLVMLNFDVVCSDFYLLFLDVCVDFYLVVDCIYVSGSVVDEEIMVQIMNVVESYVLGLLINVLKVEFFVQVLLEVCFVEVLCDDICEIGFGIDISCFGEFLFMILFGLILGDLVCVIGQVFGDLGNISIDFML